MSIGISTVFVCPDERLKATLTRVINETAGIAPVRKRNSASANRAIYEPAMAEVIINTTAPEMLAKLGKPCVGMALYAKDAIHAANEAKAIFEAEGFHAEVNTKAHEEIPDGLIVFVAVQELPGIILLYWPTDPDPELLKDMPPAEPWTEADFSG